MFSPCKVCCKKRSKHYCQIQKEKILQKQRLYYQNNEDRMLELKDWKYYQQKNEICDLKNQFNTKKIC